MSRGRRLPFQVATWKSFATGLGLSLRYFVPPPAVFTAVALFGYALSAWNGPAR